MKKKKIITEKHKKSIGSIILAFILTLSFNYSPVSLLAGVIRDKVSAYKSSVTQSYYANTEVATETNIGSGNFPSSLAKYFEGSSNNFNLEAYYNQRYSDLFAQKVEEYLTGIEDVHGEEDYSSYKYNELYGKFLKSIGFSSLSEYYEANKDKTAFADYLDFRDYFEEFFLTSHEFTDISTDPENSTKYILPAVMKKEDITPILSNYYKPYVYNAMANKLTGVTENVDTANSDGLDATTEDFYAKSKSYLRVKDYIDNIIVETIAIYSYDGESQNNYIAGIIASDAPTSRYYYYRDNTYEQVKIPSVSYEWGNFEDAPNAQYNHVRYYYFGKIADLESALTGKEAAEFNNIKKYLTEQKESELQSNPLFYRQVQPDEEGYLGVNYPIYRKYASSIPYTVTNSQYDIYVVMDDLPESMQATIDSLYYFHAITQDDIDADKYEKDASGNLLDGKDSRELKLNENNFYIQIPYSATASWGEFWYTYLFGYISSGSDLYYSNFIKKILTDSYGNSKVYLKLREDTSKIVYINEDEGMTLEEFKKANPDYTKYVVKGVRFSDAEYTPDDFYEVDFNNFSSYKNNLKSNTKIYFMREKVLYQTLDTTDEAYQKDSDGVHFLYETNDAPNTDYEKQNIPDETFEKFSKDDTNKIYVLSDKTHEPEEQATITLNGNEYTAEYITTDIISLNRNFYVPVPESVSSKIEVTGAEDGENFTFYYKHQAKERNKIYVVDSTDDAKNNEVYKNFYYEVISDNDYNTSYYNYILIGSSDPNYNKDLKLYYKYNYDLTPPTDGSTNEYYSSLFVQNEITGANAIYIVDDSLTSSDKQTYKNLYYTAISTSEYRTNSAFYVQLTEKDIEKYGDKGRYSTLYYKYVPKSVSGVEDKNYKIYEFTTSTNSSYATFYDTNSDYVASDYELITQDDPNYVAGKKLYYKKIRDEKFLEAHQYTDTYYYFQSTSNISIKANSYYAISFYVYTNGHVYEETEKDKPLNERSPLSVSGESTDDVTASIYFTDTTGNIENIEFENISTNGTWKQYYAFVATDTISSSTLSLSMYLGSKAGIAGANQANDLIVNGVVLIDDIKIMLINQTDYNKHTIDDVSVYYTPEEEEEEDDDGSSEGNSKPQTTAEPATDTDRYGNKIIIKDYNNTVRNNSIVKNWTDLFDFDSLSDSFMTEGAEGAPATSKLQEAFDKYFKTHSNYSDLLSTQYGPFSEDLTLDDYVDSLPWHYYISRNNFADISKQKFEVYKDAYSSGKLSASVIAEPTAEEKAPRGDEEKEEDSEDQKTDETDVPLIDSTFKPDNKVLMLKNTDRQRALGIVSRPFTIKQNEYYKISMWIFSPDKDAKATINLESIQKNKNNPDGALLSTSANVFARLKDYTSTPTSEYGWVNISFFIEGNAYGNQDVFLAIMADANQTIYFDNISIQKVTSSVYSNASSDSDSTTYILSLSPSDFAMSKGVTNGYFNSVNVTDNFGDVENGTDVDIDYSKPRTAKNWTIVSTNSSEVIAGVVPTSNEYLDYEKQGKDNATFYQRYNGGKHPPFDAADPDGSIRYESNLFAIYAPTQISSGLKDDERLYDVEHNTYKIYSSSISLSANKTFELSFDFFAGNNFKGYMVANIYAGSVDEARKLSSFKVPYDTSSKDSTAWDKYTFIVQNGISSTSVYIEIGIEDATGTCFFQKVSSVQSTYTSVNEARDALIKLDAGSTNLYENESASKYRFVNLQNTSLTVHSPDKNTNGTYDSKEYTSSQDNTSKYTVGKSGVVVANFYEKTTKIDYYTVTIDKVTYYIRAEKVMGDGDEETTVYKLYSDSVFKNEVTTINGKTFTIKPGTSGKSLKVLVGNSNTSYDGTSVEKTDYKYTFNQDVNIGDHFISASELNNNVSENVMILSNSLKTDYTVRSPVYTKTLSTSAYYVLKIYVKTSEISALNTDKDSGLNITISSISTSWTNVDTTKLEKSSEETDENNGFVCYQVLISTNTSSVSSFGVQFSLGSAENPCSGYAIIAGVTLESFASETLFNEYASTIEDDDTTVKRFYGKTSANTDDGEEEEDGEAGSTWATFFYIFSSLLLGIVIIIALVAIFVKKHPIKISKKYEGSDSIVITSEPQTNKPARRKSSKHEDLNQDLTIDDSVKDDNSDSDEEGFV